MVKIKIISVCTILYDDLQTDLFVTVLSDPFNFDADADPDRDPGSALKKRDLNPGHDHFFKIY